jgi:hypothetical protein
MNDAGEDKDLLDAMTKLLHRPYVPVEQWSSYAVQLSIDGWGYPYRLPRQLLNNRSVVLKMQSPFVEW